MKGTMKNKQKGFYAYHQNNSRGEWVVDDKLTMFVIIEAAHSVAANVKALSLGIYFDGCEKRIDCYCCGDRWLPMDISDEPTERPEIHGQPVARYKLLYPWSRRYPDKPFAIVHYLDGRKEQYFL